MTTPDMVEAMEGQQLRHCQGACQLITIPLESNLPSTGEVDHKHSQGSAQPPSLYDLCHLSSVQLLSSVGTHQVSTCHQLFLRCFPDPVLRLGSPGRLLTQHAPSDSCTLCWRAASARAPQPAPRIPPLQATPSSSHSFLLTFWRLLLCKARLPVCVPPSRLLPLAFSPTLCVFALSACSPHPLVSSVPKKTIYSSPPFTPQPSLSWLLAPHWAETASLDNQNDFTTPHTPWHPLCFYWNCFIGEKVYVTCMHSLRIKTTRTSMLCRPHCQYDITSTFEAPCKGDQCAVDLQQPCSPPCWPLKSSQASPTWAPPSRFSPLAGMGQLIYLLEGSHEPEELKAISQVWASRNKFLPLWSACKWLKAKQREPCHALPIELRSDRRVGDHIYSLPLFAVQCSQVSWDAVFVTPRRN